MGRYVSQPSGGGALMILSSLWGHCGGYSKGPELGTEAWSAAAGLQATWEPPLLFLSPVKLCPTCLAAPLTSIVQPDKR